MPPPDDGNEYLPFTRMIQLKHTSDPNVYQSTALPFTPGGISGGRGSAYGGHVYAQAAWAACQTVPKGFRISNISGTFLLSGLPTVPYTYKVQKIRDGRSYCTRIINVVQKEEAGIMFTATCSFKTYETGPLSVQSGISIHEKYKSVLEGRRPEDFEECPGFDLPWYWAKQKRGEVENDEFPGLQCRKVDMKRWSRDKHPLDRRQLIFYRTIGEIGEGEDVNLHLVAHLYASDRNSLFIVSNHLDIGDLYSGIGSLVHNVVFHSNAEEMLLGEGRWFVKEDSTTRYENGRALFLSRVWSPEGRHVMSVMQDGLIRLPKDGKVVEGVVEGWEGLREEDDEGVRREREKGKL